MFLLNRASPYGPRRLIRSALCRNPNFKLGHYRQPRFTLTKWSENDGHELLDLV
jgi:hypothetical protein